MAERVLRSTRIAWTLLVVSLVANVVLAGLAWRHERLIDLKRSAKGALGLQAFQPARETDVTRRIRDRLLREHSGQGGRALIDGAREFVKRNSVHDETPGPERDRAFDTPALLESLWEREAGRRGPAPVSCTPATWAIQAILASLGIEANPVAVWGSGSHTILEAVDPDTGRPELHDPDFGTFYRSKSDQERVSAVRALQLGVENIEPCRTATECGPEIPSLIGPGKLDFSLLEIAYRGRDFRRDIFLVDRRLWSPERLSLKIGDQTMADRLRTQRNVVYY